MIQILWIAIVSLLSMLTYYFIKKRKSNDFNYISPHHYKNRVRENITKKNPDFINNLQDSTKLTNLLQLKAKNFLDIFLLGLSRNKEYKPEFYEDLSTMLKNFIAYFLLYIDLQEETNSAVNWPLLDHILKDMEDKLDQVTPLITSRLDTNEKTGLHQRQTVLLMHIKDIKGLRNILYN